MIYSFELEVCYILQSGAMQSLTFICSTLKKKSTATLNSFVELCVLKSGCKILKVFIIFIINLFTRIILEMSPV